MINIAGAAHSVSYFQKPKGNMYTHKKVSCKHNEEGTYGTLFKL